VNLRDFLHRSRLVYMSLRESWLGLEFQAAQKPKKVKLLIMLSDKIDSQVEKPSNNWRLAQSLFLPLQ